MYDHTGTRICTFDLTTAEGLNVGSPIVAVGDLTGDGIPDLLLYTLDMAFVFRNEKGKMPYPPAPLGTGLNFTYY